MPSRRTLATLLLLACLTVTAAQPTRQKSIEQLFNQLRKNPPELYAFLLRMPKGADLHNHSSGAVYAESFLERAANAPLCIDTKLLSLVAPIDGTQCAEGQISGTQLPHNNALAGHVIDSLSMRDFVPGPESGHDHFFATFDKFSAASHLNEGAEIAELAERAAQQNESYLELMALSAAGPVSALAKQAGVDEANLESTRQKLLQEGLEAKIPDLRAHVDEIEQQRMDALHCNSSHPKSGCVVRVGYVFQVLREFPKEQVFAQMLAGFMLAASDPRVVAINFVQPEDGYNSMHDYSLHMRFVAFARKLFPSVHVSLHAGELASGLVPPEGLRFHITEAVDVAHAERIGHGVDIMYETKALETLRTMRERHIDVEINLTSNAGILGVKGDDHPFMTYRKYGVPVTLSTDDEGVERTHLTEEYKRAALTYNLSYAELKQLARNSIEYSFTPPAEKAQLKSDLEKRFREFETWALTNFRP
jgi:adenosine deaminase